MNMRRTKKIFVTVMALAVAASMSVIVVPAGAAGTSKQEVQVFDYELALCNVDHSGEIESIKVVEWLALKGDGEVDFREKAAFDDLGRFQGVRGFSGPSVEGDELVWDGLSADGNSNVLAATDLSEANVETAKKRIPLKVEFTYEWDGKRVKDPEELTGKSGHFKLYCEFTNQSKETTTLEYKDPETGEMKEKQAETYLPMVIQPYDWVWDNTVYYNLETDPTGLTFWMPDTYQTGWSVPLFPPATEESHTITVEADVKNFKLPPLTIVVAFVFPKTNQIDTLPTFKAGLVQLYDGVKQLNAGLDDAVKGVGDPGTADTLLFGITAIDDGLRQMADAAEGVPYAKANIDRAMIPGVKEAAAGIGSETAENTLLWAGAQAQAGLQGIAAGIGSMDTDPSLLYAMAQMGVGLEDIKSGVGSETADGTLLYAITQMQGGLNDIKSNIGSSGDLNTLLWGVAQVVGGIDSIVHEINKVDPNPPYTNAGLLQALSMMLTGVDTMIAGITYIDPTYANPGLLQGLDMIKAGITNPSGVPKPGILEGLQSIQGATEAGTGTIDAGILTPFQSTIDHLEGDYPSDPNVDALQVYCDNLKKYITDATYSSSIYAGATAMIGGIGSESTSGTLLNGLAKIRAGVSSGDPAHPGILEGLQSVEGGLQGIHTAITYVDPYPFDNPGLLQALAMMRAGLTSGDYGHPGIKEGLELISGGIGDPSTAPSLLYAATAVQGGLLQIAAGIGDGGTSDTLLFAVDQVEEGLNQMLAGIGGQEVPNTLIYALAQMQMGLHQIKAGMSTGDPNNPGLLEGLVMLSAGLGDIIAGLGSAESPDTLLYGTGQIKGGLTQLGEGLTKATAEGTQVMLEGLYENIAFMNLTESELEAIEKRGEEYNHLLGASDQADESHVRFVYQSPATYNYVSGSTSSWIVALILSLVILALLVGGGIMLSRRSAS